MAGARRGSGPVPRSDRDEGVAVPAIPPDPIHIPAGAPPRRARASSQGRFDLDEQAVADFFDARGRSGAAGLLSAVRHPIELSRVLRAIRALPVLHARIGSSQEADIVRCGLLRTSRVARWAIDGTTAVLELPSNTDDYLRGSSATKRRLRTRVHRAQRAGMTCERVDDPTIRREILRLTDEYELHHPIEAYRGTNPSTGHLLPRETWLLARTRDGRPLLLAVPAVDDEWAVLLHFRTLEDSDDARLARYWMSVMLVDELIQRGVRYLADTLSPIGLGSGLRLFQRRLGYRFVRVRVR